MSGEFEGCTVYIYDTDGNVLTTSRINAHNKTDNSIEVESSQILLDNRRCSLFILTSPTPYAYSGTIHPHGIYVTIKLYRGMEKESRSTKRYKISGKASIIAYLCEGKNYKLHKNLDVDLVNISTTGVRFRTSYNMLSVEDGFKFHIKIDDNLKSLNAEVKNLRDFERESSEYGCILTGKDDDSVEL